MTIMQVIAWVAAMTAALLNLAIFSVDHLSENEKKVRNLLAVVYTLGIAYLAYSIIEWQP